MNIKKLLVEGQVVTVTADGHIYDCRGREVKQTVLRSNSTPNDYRVCSIGGRMHYVHRVVARAFLGEPLPGMVADHIDGNKSNNDVSNLRWTTRSVNRKNTHNTLTLPPVSSFYIFPVGFQHQGAVYNNWKEVSEVLGTPWSVFSQWLRCFQYQLASRSYHGFTFLEIKEQ